MSRRLAQERLDRRMAASVLSGQSVGRRAPLEWLIVGALRDYASAPARAVCLPLRMLSKTRPRRSFWLSIGVAERGAVIEEFLRKVTVALYGVEFGAPVLFDLVKDDPIAAERLLAAIEAATVRSDR